MEARSEKPYELKEERLYTGIKPEHLKQAFQKLFTDRHLIKD